MDTYGHLFEEMQGETADKMDGVLSPKPDPVVVKTVVKSRLRRVK
jgi:hypothetical protein